MEHLRKDTEIVSYTPFISCLAGNCSFTINWMGEMRPCLTLPEPSVSVFESGFTQAWKEIAEGSKKLCMNQHCTCCEFRPVCKTCVSSALLETGAYSGLPDYHCRYAEELSRLLNQEYDRINSGT